MIIRSSWQVFDGIVRPLGARLRVKGREAQRARIRERIAEHGSTSIRSMDAAHLELKRRIKEREA